jgi:hypothetical protein
MSTIGQTCAIAASLISGRAHDRHSIAKDFEMQVAAADRHIQHLLTVPGFVVVKTGRRRLITFSFSKALQARGL